jgi:Tfp pilus assembly protein PilF
MHRPNFQQRIVPKATCGFAKTLFLAAVLLAIPAGISAQLRSPAQPVEIRGQLRFAVGGTPADEVVVRLDQLSGGFIAETRTDRLGKFRFTGLLPIQYQLIIRHPGFQEIQREVNLIMTGSEYLQLQLVADVVRRTAERTPTKLLDVNVPAEARKEFERGEELVVSGEKSKIVAGIRHYEKALLLYPGFLEAQLRLGTAYMDLLQWADAEKLLSQANVAHPRTPNVLFALGELYLQQHKTAEAERMLREGLEIEPRSWQGHFTLGRLYWNAGDIVKAGRQVGFALQLNPNLAEAHLLGGNIYLRARKVPEAQFEFEEYLRLAPKGQYAVQTKALLEKMRRQNGEKH